MGITVRSSVDYMYPDQTSTDTFELDSIVDDRRVIQLCEVTEESFVGETSPLGVSSPQGQHAKKDKFFMIDESLPEDEIRREKWVRDELSSHCGICSSEFTLFLRKHHCRCCGKIFCYTCTNYCIEIPSQDEYQEQTTHNVTTAEKEKVCSFCYKKIIDFNHLKDLYLIVRGLPLDILQISKLLLVSRSWNRVARYYLSKMKRLARSNEVTRSDVDLIWMNRFLWSGHSHWIVKFIHSLAYIDSQLIDDKELLQILYSPRNIRCPRLFCGENCRQELATDEAILALSHPLKNSVSESYLMDVLCSGEREEILAYLPVLVVLLKDSQAKCDRGEPILSNYLFSISKRNYEFANFLFWEMTVKMENPEYSEFYENLRTQLVNSIQGETANHLKNTFYLVENMVEMSKNPTDFPRLLNSYFISLGKNQSLPVSSPVNPYEMLTGVEEGGIRVRGSASRPISIPFYSQNKDKTYEILFKHDDLRKDQIIMNLIKLTDAILKREENLDLHIITYNVLPISSEYGFVQIVENAETILSINRKHKFSILNFILEHNPTKSVEELRERFTRSCVAYCLLSYLLGIGDRHLENIMLLPTGEIFHIDFGFVLGHDPKLLAPEIRITDEMIDAMGGYESKHYAKFKELCSRAFLCLRKHASTFRVVLDSFAKANPPIDPRLTEEFLERFINNRFLLGENVHNAKLYLINKVSNRNFISSESLIDFCHQAQDNSSSLSQGLASSALSLGNKVLGYIWK